LVLFYKYNWYIFVHIIKHHHLNQYTKLNFLLILGSLGISILYAYLRYVSFGKFAAEYMFWFVLNKGLILAAIGLVPALIIRTDLFLKISVNLLIASHILISLYLFKPTIYPKLFDQYLAFNQVGMYVVGFGVLAALFFANTLVRPFIELSRPWNQLLLLSSALVHNMVIGFSGWLSPAKWNAGMPPITLISSLLMLVSMLLIVRKMLQKS